MVGVPVRHLTAATAANTNTTNTTTTPTNIHTRSGCAGELRHWAGKVFTTTTEITNTNTNKNTYTNTYTNNTTTIANNHNITTATMH